MTADGGLVSDDSAPNPIAIVPASLVESNPGLREHVLARATLDEAGNGLQWEVQRRPHSDLRELADLLEDGNPGAPIAHAVLEDMRSVVAARDAEREMAVVTTHQRIKNSASRERAVARGQWMAFTLAVASIAAALIASLVTDNPFAALPFLALTLVGVVKAILDGARS